MNKLEPTEIDRAYAAGFFDGEGHISIAFSTARKCRGYSYDRYTLSVSMSQNDRRPLDWLSSRFGGNVRHLVAKRSYDKGKYSRYDWSLACTNAAEFLRKVRPWLLVKGDQADIAIQFQNTMTRKAKPTPPEVIELRKNLAQSIKDVRKRTSSSGGQSVAQFFN